MALELVFTSTPKGLKHGSRGFTTVACTKGMPANILRICETLSGYVHVYPQKGPDYARNPVAYSHYPYRIGGKEYSILSRISAYGFDYSGRTNKLAHHIVLERTELNRAGPTWLMNQTDFFRKEWNGEARFLPQGSIEINDQEIDSFKANNWGKLTSHPEWAGILAQRFIDKPEKPVFIVFEPGMDLLPLIEEAQLLLPPEIRWESTFNTYFTSLPVGTNCAWRCCLPESDALNKSRRIPDAIVFDLVQGNLRGEIPANDDLQKAAKGDKKPGWTQEKKIPESTRQERAFLESSESKEPIVASAGRQDSGKKIPRGAAPKRIKMDYSNALRPAAPPNKKTRKWPLLATLIVAGIIIGFFLLHGSNDKKEGEPVSADEKSNEDKKDEPEKSEEDKGISSRKDTESKGIEEKPEEDDETAGQRGQPVEKKVIEDGDKKKLENAGSPKQKESGNESAEQDKEGADTKQDIKDVHFVFFEPHHSKISLNDLNTDELNAENPYFVNTKGKKIQIAEKDFEEPQNEQILSTLSTPKFEYSRNNGTVAIIEEKETRLEIEQENVGAAVLQQGDKATIYVIKPLLLEWNMIKGNEAEEFAKLTIDISSYEQEFLKILFKGINEGSHNLQCKGDKWSVEIPNENGSYYLTLTLTKKGEKLKEEDDKLKNYKSTLGKFIESKDNILGAKNFVSYNKNHNFENDFKNILACLEKTNSEEYNNEIMSDLRTHIIGLLKDLKKNAKDNEKKSFDDDIKNIRKAHDDENSSKLIKLIKRALNNGKFEISRRREHLFNAISHRTKGLMSHASAIENVMRKLVTRQERECKKNGTGRDIYIEIDQETIFKTGE